jgi:Ca2+-binding RTX toxin-like protein
MVTTSYSFDEGLGPWMSWMPASLLDEGAMRFQAPGVMDPNHLDGIGPLWLVAHLSLPALDGPGVLDLRDAAIDLTVRGFDFNANGSKLVWWLVSYTPSGEIVESYYQGLQSTNWAYTAGDMAASVGTDWQTLTVEFPADGSGWTYAGNNVSGQGSWGWRYNEVGIGQTLGAVSATLHLAVVGSDPSQAPSGFLDIASVVLHTQTAPTPYAYQVDAALPLAAKEDTDLVATLPTPAALPGPATAFALVPGSVLHGSVTIDAGTGEFRFTPEANYNGDASFSYTASDADGNLVQARVALRIANTNDAPTASVAAEDLQVAADTAFTHMLMKGADIDGDRLSFVLVEGSVSHGTLSLEAGTGRYTFTPEAGYSGSASFQYQVSDGQLLSAPKMVELTVLPAGQLPARLDFNAVSDLLVARQFDAAAFHMLLLANAGDTNAAYHLGSWLGAGRFFNRDTSLAASYLARAVATVPEARLELAALLTSGDGVPRDLAQARQLLEATPTLAEARYRLALLQDGGFGGAQDKASAIDNFREAAAKGNAAAMYELGRHYLQGDGVDHNAASAYFWLQAALQLGNPNLLPALRSVIPYNRDQARAELEPETVQRIDAAVAVWAPGDPVLTNAAPVAAPAPETYTSLNAAPVLGTLLPGSDADGDQLEFRLLAGSASNATVVLNAQTGQFTITPNAAYAAAQAGWGQASFAYAIWDGLALSAPKTVTVALQQTTVYTTQAELMAAPGVQRLQYVGSDDFVGIGNDGNNYIVGGAGNDRLQATAGDNVLIGNAGDDLLIAGPGRDYLIGGAGNDTLVSLQGGLAALQGGLGNDVYIIGEAPTSLIEFADEGIDEIRTTRSEFVLPLHFEWLTAIGTGNFRGVGNAQDNRIQAGPGDAVLVGGGGNDVLIGGDGHDVLDARGGRGTLSGGRGNDVYLVDDAATQIIELADQGIDEVRTTLATWRLGANVENLTALGAGGLYGVGNALDNRLQGGAGNDTLIGVAGNNTLVGGGGRDYLIGGAGNDVLDSRGGMATLQGGAGDDVYYIDDSRTSVIEFAGEGIDEVRTTLSAYTLRANFERLVYTGAGAFTGTGNVLDNWLQGGTGNDTLIGVAGNNTLVGGGGRDLLVGGAGDDVLDSRGGTGTLKGGAGDDIYLVDDSRTVLVEHVGEGIDEVRTSLAAWWLGANFEHLTAVGSGGLYGVGNALDNHLQGGAGNDTLIGVAGNNTLVGGGGRDYLIGGTGDDVLDSRGGSATLQGGAGNDVYYIDDARTSVVEFANEGIDEVRTTLSAYTLRANFERLLYEGTGAFFGTGNELDNLLQGGSGNDRLVGGAGNDVLIGGAGNDVLTGGTGADTFVWREGDASADQPAFDTVTDFDLRRFDQGGDRLDLSAWLQTDDLDQLLGRLFVSDSVAGSVLQVLQPDGGAVLQSVLLQGVDLSPIGSLGQIVQQLLDNGNLVTSGG